MWAKAEADALVEMHDEELKEMELSVKLQNDELSGAAQREIDARALRGMHRECGRYLVNYRVWTGEQRTHSQLLLIRMSANFRRRMSWLAAVMPSHTNTVQTATITRVATAHKRHIRS